MASFIINAINGVAAGRFVYASSGNGEYGDDIGITAAEGSSNTQITLTMDTAGVTGNVSSALASVSGVDIIDVTNFTSGSDGNNTVRLTQWATGSAGNIPNEPHTLATAKYTIVPWSGGAGPTIGEDYLFVLETDTGPGLQPLLLDSTDTTAIGSLPPPTDITIPSNGRVIITEGIFAGATPQTQDDIADLEAGGYAVAYHLEDSDTGRKSSLSKVSNIKAEHLAYKPTGKITIIRTSTEINQDEIVIDDGTNSVCTFTFSTLLNTVTGSNGEYVVGVSDRTALDDRAEQLAETINLANTNNDLKIVATWTTPNAYVDLEHEKVGTEGNLLITGSTLPVEDPLKASNFDVEGMTGGVSYDPGNIGVEIVYDSDKFDKAYIYRSVRVESAGGSYSASVVQLDKIITLNDYLLVSQTGMTGTFKRAIYYFELEDLALLYKDPFTDRSIFDADMPKSGTVIEFDGILLTSNISGQSVTSVSNEDRPLDQFRGLGEFKWSSVRDVSPELFPPENYFIPSKFSNEVIKFERSGGAILGLANNVVMHISRESSGVISYLKVVPIHEGYGVINEKSSSVVGPRIYYINDQGVKSIDSQGRLDSLHALDGVIEDWKNDLDSVTMAYDSRSSILFLYNKVQGKAALLWFSSSMVSELWDLPFELVTSGSWPSNLNDVDSSLTERSFFIQNQPDPSNLNVNFTPCAWVVDSKRETNITGSSVGNFNGEKRVTLLQGVGDSRFTVLSYDAATKILTLDGSILGQGEVAPFLSGSNGNWVGAYVYILNSSVESRIGLSAQIRVVTEYSEVGIGPALNATITFASVPVGWSIGAGDRIGISPVYIKWAGSLLGFNDMQDTKTPTQGGIHRTRSVDSISCYFSSVSGAPTRDLVDSTDMFYKGLVFEGDSDSEVSSGIPKNLSGDFIKSIVEGESTNWVAFESHGVRGAALSPGIEIHVPDLDFKLLSVIIEGKILSSLRTERPS